MKLHLKCPAKVNLFLAVGPRDARGYHPLRTIFQAVDLCDILEITLSSAGVPPASPCIEIVGAELPSNNTVTKALRLSQEVFALGVESVHLTKVIPMQSGLGGGSSDAAGVLRALSHVRPVPLTETESVAAAVGADVPFFLTGGRAKGEGYGDRITALPDDPEEWFVLVKLPIGCSTAEMYARLDAEPREWRDWPSGDELYNDFERVAPRECLELVERLKGLGASGAALSGSGSSVFGRFSNPDVARGVAKRFQGEAAVWVAKSLSRAESLRVDSIG
jgi:4-diphosphocytidyl-2-C-methyl-D-erythritol kinase